MLNREQVVKQGGRADAAVDEVGEQIGANQRVVPGGVKVQKGAGIDLCRTVTMLGVGVLALTFGLSGRVESSNGRMVRRPSGRRPHPLRQPVDPARGRRGRSGKSLLFGGVELEEGAARFAPANKAQFEALVACGQWGKQVFGGPLHSGGAGSLHGVGDVGPHDGPHRWASAARSAVGAPGPVLAVRARASATSAARRPRSPQSKCDSA